MRVRRMIGYVPQLLSADAGLTGRENVELFARLFDVPRAQRAGRVGEALAAMGLTEAADRLVKTYSGGMVRRLELAQALVNAPGAAGARRADGGPRPDRARRRLGARRRSCASTTGMTVLLTTHYMEEADVLCDRVALMHLGTVRAEGSPGRAQGGARARRDARRRVPPLHRGQRSTSDRRKGGLVKSGAPGGPPVVVG